jgi:hypothetical protein
MAKTKRPRLTAKETEFVRTAKRLTPRGEVPGPEELNTAAKLTYDCVPKSPGHTATSIASTIVGQKLKKEAIFEQLAGMPVEEARKKFRAKMWQWLLGDDDKLGEKDGELARTAARLLARQLIPNEEHTVQETNVFSGRSTEDIEFYAQHGYWPEELIKQAGKDDQNKVVMQAGEA